ncbi:hypothetical protein JCM5296_001738 [Sporobolomyces johnsonii]
MQFLAKCSQLIDWYEGLDKNARRKSSMDSEDRAIGLPWASHRAGSIDGTTVEAVRVVDEYKCKAILCTTMHAVETEDFTELHAWWGDEVGDKMLLLSLFTSGGK